MQLTNLNPRPEIGANALFVELGPFRILVDSGLSPREVGWEALPLVEKLPEGGLDFIILTHCHLDHLGALPVVMRQQPQAPIFLSLPSQAIAGRMMMNSYSVMKRQREELGVREYPLYTPTEIQKVEAAFRPLGMGRPHKFSREGDEIEVTFFPAGHVVGAVGVMLTYRHRHIFFTGDVLFRDQRTLPGAAFPDMKVDTLVMETTRGATEPPGDRNRVVETKRFLGTLAKTLGHGGSCLMPAFALGRMQEVLSLIHDATRRGEIPQVPVHCSGLGMDLVDYLDEIDRKTGMVRFRRKVVTDLGVKPIRDRIRPGKAPSTAGIYILGSGMLLENTPSWALAASLLHEPCHAVCYTGYCDPETPGGKMLQTAKGEAFTFDGMDYVTPMRANVERFDLSGHADRDELLDFALSMDPRAVVLTHGDPPARDWFLDAFLDRDPRVQVFNPEPGESCRV